MSDLSELHKDVAETNSLLRSYIAKNEERLAKIEDMQDDHSTVLWTKKDGLEMRTDRLEQTEATRKWVIRAVGTGIVGIIADKFLHILPK